MLVSKSIELLSKVSFFSKISESDLKDIAHTTVQKKYNLNQAVFVEGDPSVGLFIVEQGWFKVIKTSTNGREQILNFFGPGEAFNELSLLADIPSPVTAIALEPSSVLFIQKETMLQMLKTHPELAEAVIKTLAGRVQHLVALVEDLSLRSVEARLARLLLEQASDETVHRHQWATQTELAARLGTVTDVLSRTLRKLSDEGLIQVSRHQIQILKPEKLKAKANNE